MADIAMCFNEKCPSKNKCYRATAIPNEPYQNSMDFQVLPDEIKCDSYIPNKKED